MGSFSDIILAENEFIWNGGRGSGWFAPPKGTHIPKDSSAIYKEIYHKRRKMYSTSEEFELANNWLRSNVGGGGESLDKAKPINFDPSKEIEFSRQLQKKEGEQVIYRYQTQPEFNKTTRQTSRWSTLENSNKDKGEFKFVSKVNESNIVIHPLVLYSSLTGTPGALSAYAQEWEYIVFNKGLKVERIK